jgi:penicillin amidase
MSKIIQVVLVIAGILGGLILLAWGTWTWFSRQAIPQTSGTIKVQGLQEPVEILRDEYGVAHIYARSPEDLFFAQGYTLAQERFWQMEFQRRVASGRLSEIFGEATLETDRFIRHFGFRANTEKAYEMLDAETKRVVDAYAAGVNAYIQDRSPAQLGLEFALLGLQGVDFAIEPWTAVDSMVWGYMMIYNQTGVPGPDVENIDLLALVGNERYAELNPPYRSDRPTIIQEEDLPENLRTAASLRSSLSEDELAYLMSVQPALQAWAAPAQLAGLGYGAGGASNSFAVSPDLSATGKAILANDPHMSINAPALWYEIGMHCVEKSAQCPYNFRGFALPGVPGILIGHNDRLAWGLTNANFDAEDIFIERINPDNPNQYEVNGRWEDMQLRQEVIKVRGQDDPVVVQVRKTRNGLVISDDISSERPYTYDQGEPELYALALRWPGLEPVRSVQANHMVIRAQNWEEFNAALELFDAGKQNWLYADVEGNIGVVMPGKVPIRAKGDGTLPVPGWNEEFRWTGYIPYNKLPRVLNPEQGFIAAPNNPQVRAGSYPYLINMDQDRGQRAERIIDLLTSDRDGLSLDDLAAIQTDNQNMMAVELLPYLEELTFDDPALAAARDWFIEWDGQMRMDSSQAVLYAMIWKHLNQALFHDKLPEEHWPSGADQTEDVVHFLLLDPENKWWDARSTVDVLETRDNTLRRVFTLAYNEAVETLGKDTGKWQWGDLHTITFVHATLGKTGIGLIDNLFNRGPYPAHGDTNSVQKTCWDANESFTLYCIPNLRQIIDLGDLSNSRMVHSFGQSGHPMSPLYDNLVEAWRTFEYHPSNWLRAQVEAGKYQSLILQPR